MKEKRSPDGLNYPNQNRIFFFLLLFWSLTNREFHINRKGLSTPITAQS